MVKRSRSAKSPLYKEMVHNWRWTCLISLLFAIFVFGRPIGNLAVQVFGYEDQRWEKMVNSVSETIGQYKGEVGLYIKDIETGRLFEYNSNRPFVSASLIKIPIMAATFRAIRDGKLRLDSKMKYRRRYRRGGSGRLKWTRSGRGFTVSHLVYEMITHSDNTATAMLIHQLGYKYLNQSFSQFGLEVTRIRSTGMSLANRVSRTKDNFTTPREMGVLLEEIYNHRLVNDGLSDLMLEILKGTKARSRLRRYLPENWKLARKTGLLRKNCHDVGIVFTPEGDYIICVLTSENDTYRKAKGFIASIGQKAYAYMGNT